MMIFYSTKHVLKITRFLRIFIYYSVLMLSLSKQSLLIIIHLCQRFLQSSNYSICEIIFSSPRDAVLILPCACKATIL